MDINRSQILSGSLKTTGDSAGIFAAHIASMAEQGRASHNDTYDLISDYVHPPLRGFSNNRINAKNRYKGYNSSRAHAGALNMVARLQTGITPVNENWHELTSPDLPKDILDTVSVRTWLAEATETLFQHRRNKYGGFEKAMKDTLFSMIVLGTGAMFVRRGASGFADIDYEHVPLRDLYLVSDSKGFIVAVIRFLEMRPDTLRSHWPERMKKYEDNFQVNEETKISICHMIRLRYSYEFAFLPDHLRDFPWQELYFEYQHSGGSGASKQNFVFHEGGYKQNPYLIGRIGQYGSDAYGYGIGESALSELRILEETSNSLITSVHQAATPALDVADNHFRGGAIDLNPGAVNISSPYDSMVSGRKGVEVIQTGDQPRFAFELLSHLEKETDSYFFRDSFSDPYHARMPSATEALERKFRELKSLFPFVIPVMQDIIAPMIDREWTILQDLNKLPDMHEPRFGLADNMRSLALRTQQDYSQYFEKNH